MLDMSNVPSCILRFLVQKGRFGAQGIFETQRSLQLIFVRQGVAYFLLAVKMIKISEPLKMFF